MFQHDQLSKAFLFNAIFLFLSGLLMLLMNNALMESIGLKKGYILPLLGITLILFAVFLLLVSRVTKMNKLLAWAIVLVELFSVIGCGWVIFEVDLTFTGNSLVFLFASGILAFTVLQLKGIQRSKALKVRV
jgi:hypothetical protein